MLEESNKVTTFCYGGKQRKLDSITLLQNPQTASYVLWTKLCPSIIHHIEILIPAIPECDYIWIYEL